MAVTCDDFDDGTFMEEEEDMHHDEISLGYDGNESDIGEPNVEGESLDNVVGG